MTDIEKVRLLIGAVVSAAFPLDAEIQAFLDLGGSVFMAAALALKSWAATGIEAMKSETIGDYRYEKGAVDNALKLAANYEARDSQTPAFAYAEMDLTGSGEVVED